MPFVIFCLVLLLQPTGTEQTVGDWSAENQNVQARFLVRYHSSSLDGKTDGPYSQFLVYLELRNTAPTLSTLVRKFDLDAATDITYRVTDERGREIASPVAFRSTFLPGAYSLVLPPDSLLRFPVSVNGGGVFEDKTKLDVSPKQGIWYFDETVRRDFRLSGTLRISQPPERYQTYWWRGEIQIPPVALKIPGR